MNLNNLETLVWISKLAGVGAAAKHLNVTQPAVTRRIRDLEDELGVPLVERDGRGIKFTPAGRRCLEFATGIVADVSRMKSELSASNAGFIGTIKLGVGEVLALDGLDRVMRRIASEYPNVRLELDIDVATRMVTKLQNRTIDLALIPGPINISGAVTYPLGYYRLKWMAKADLVKNVGQATPEELRDIPIIRFSPDSITNEIVDTWFGAFGIVPTRSDYCNNLGVVASLVKNGRGVSLLPQHLFKANVQSKDLIEFDETPQLPYVDYWAAFFPSLSQPIYKLISEIAQAESPFTLR